MPMNQTDPNCTRFNVSCHVSAEDEMKLNLILFVLGSSLVGVNILFGGALIATYLIFRELRTLYGLLLVNLVFVLAVSSLLVFGVVIPSTIPEVCQLVAIVLHYLTLVQSLSISCLIFEAAIHFYQALRASLPSPDQHPKRTFMKCMLVCWGVPLIIIAAFVIVNYTVADSIRYGETDGRCLIDGMIPLIVGVGLPICISSLFNVLAGVFIACVLLRISHQNSHRHMPQHLRKKNILRDVRVVFAVFIASGISWIFVALIVISPEPWIEYAFVIVESFQLAFLTLIYTCTKKVFWMYRDLLLCRRKSNKKTSIPHVASNATIV